MGLSLPNCDLDSNLFSFPWASGSHRFPWGSRVDHTLGTFSILRQKHYGKPHNQIYDHLCLEFGSSIGQVDQCHLPFSSMSCPCQNSAYPYARTYASTKNTTRNVPISFHFSNQPNPCECVLTNMWFNHRLH